MEACHRLTASGIQAIGRTVIHTDPLIEPGGQERVNHVTEPEEASPEMLIRELAEILAGGISET